MTEQFNWRSYLKVHPAADLFPLMSADELRELREDIEKHGLMSPIVLWSDDDKATVSVLDGRNRLDGLEAAPIRASMSEHESTMITPEGRLRDLYVIQKRDTGRL